MKTLAEALWTIVRWTLPLTVAAVIAALAIGSSRIGEELRRRIEERLRAALPALDVRVESAALVEGTGIVARGVSIADPGGQERGPFVRIDEVHLACRTTLAELATGAPTITAVRLLRPAVHATRAADGRWNVARLVPGRAAAAPVPVLVEGATLVAEDVASGRRLALRDGVLDLRPDATGGLVVRGEAGGDLLDRITFAGRVGTGDRSFDLSGSIDALDVSPRLHGLLPGAVPAPAADWLAGLRGQAALDWRVAGRLDALEAAVFTLSGKLDSGRFEHAALPFTVGGVSAAFTADRSGISCQRLEAQSGSTLLRGSGRLAGWHAAADFDVLVEAERLLVGRHWEEFLPEVVAAQWSKLLPAGEIDVRAQVSRRSGALVPDVSVRCRNVSLTHYRFPYRLDRTVGTVTYKGHALAIHLTGQAGGHPVHVGGTIDTSSPGGRGFIEVRGDGMRIDDALLAAMPARSADIVRALRGSGTFDFVFRHDRAPQLPKGHANSLGIRLEQCTLAYAGFPYPLSNVSGTIRMEQGRWTIREITGSNDTGVVRCTGALEPLEDGDGELILQLAGTGVVLERELRDALPRGMGRIWDDVDPRGSADFKATVRHRVKQRRTDVELEATPQGDTVSIEPAWFPYRLERLRGRVVWRDGQLRFEDVRGEHARTTVATVGRCRFTPDGGWHVTFERLTAERLRVEHDVLQALPDGLRRAIAGVRLRGLLALDGTLDIYSTAPVVVTAASGLSEPVPGPPAATWDMHVDLEQAALDVGVPLDHVHGGIRLRGAGDGARWRCRGDLALDSAIVKGVQLTMVQGPLLMDEAGVRFGAAAAGDGVGPRRLAARLAEGTLLVDGSVEAGDAGAFAVTAALGDASLERLATEVTGVAHRYRGRLQAGIEVRGSRAGTHSLVGRGQVRLRDADIYELPLVVALLKILRVKAPDRTAFGSSVVDFRIEGPRAYLDNIELSGDAISLVGAGELDFDTNLRLTFRPLMGAAESQLPVMKRLLGGAGGQFLLVHVGGTIADPDTSTEAFPTLAAALQTLQSRRPGPGGARTASRQGPR